MKGDYGQSSEGNFKVVATIDVPHPYCITLSHVGYAADKCGGVLDETAGVKCGTPGCSLSYKQHEKALLVVCKEEIKDADGKANPELHAYLLLIKEECEKNGYVGFAFKREF